MPSTREDVFIEKTQENKDLIRQTVNRIQRKDKILVLVKWDSNTGILRGVINDTWPDVDSTRFPSLDPKKHVTWAWDQSTFVEDGKPDEINNINDDLSDTIFTGASEKLSDAGGTASAKASDAFLKIAGIKKQSSHASVKVRYWFVHEPASASSVTPTEKVPVGEVAEENAESAEVEAQDSFNSLQSALKNLADKSSNAATNPAAKIAAEAAVAEAKIAAEEAQKRAEEAKAESEAIKNTSLRYSEMVYPNQNQARFRELFVEALNNTGRPTWWSLGSSWNSYVIDSSKIHRYGPGGTMLWGVQHGDVGYFAEENLIGVLSVVRVPNTQRPFPRGWVAGTKKPDEKARESDAKADGSAASGGSTASGGTPKHSSSMCNTTFDENAFRAKLAIAIKGSQTWIDWGKSWFKEKLVDVSALDFAKNRVHRHVTMDDGKTCVWRGIMARHDKDIVVFFIDPTTEKLGEVHSIDGWNKEWFTFGGSGGVPAVKPSMNADGVNKAATSKDDSAEPEHGPLNKQFTALFARLRDLEARLAPPQTPQTVRDARPVREHLDELREKIARTRSLISRDVAGLRRVHV
jgi:hypothetical protein